MSDGMELLSRLSAGGRAGKRVWDFLAYPTKDFERVCPAIHLCHIAKVGCESVQRNVKPTEVDLTEAQT